VAGRGLSPKRQQFVAEYLIDLNATAAYRRAGYAVKNDRVARVEGCRLLADPNVRAAIEEARRAMSERKRLTADEVIDGLREEAAYRGEDASHAARVAAWSWLGRHLAMFTDRHEYLHPDDAADRALDAELERLAAASPAPGAGPQEAAPGSGGHAGNGRPDPGPMAD
jgi:hypothetical protein